MIFGGGIAVMIKLQRLAFVVSAVALLTASFFIFGGLKPGSSYGASSARPADGDLARRDQVSIPGMFITRFHSSGKCFVSQFVLMMTVCRLFCNT